MKKSTTPTFLLELPLAVVTGGQAKHLRAHFEVARCLYNALLGEALARLHRMRADPAWQAARALPKTQKQERATAFSHLRQQYGFSEYALHDFAKRANCAWIADHIDAVTAQTLATRAYQAANRVCLGKAKKVRFKSKDVASILSRASGTILGCALCSNLLKRGIKGGWFGARTVCPPLSTGMIRWSNMDWTTGSSIHG